MEEAAGLIVAAQLLAAAEQRSLPTRYELAQQSRAKVLELSSGVATAREVHVPPMELLAQLLSALVKAHFTVPADKPLAVEQVLDFDWVVKTAIEQARLDPLTHSTPPDAAAFSPLKVLRRVIVRTMHHSVHTRSLSEAATEVRGREQQTGAAVPAVPIFDAVTEHQL